MPLVRLRSRNSVAQLDVHPAGNQELISLIPDGPTTFFRGD